MEEFAPLSDCVSVLVGKMYCSNDVIYLKYVHVYMYASIWTDFLMNDGALFCFVVFLAIMKVLKQM